MGMFFLSILELRYEGMCIGQESEEGFYMTCYINSNYFQKDT